MSPIFGKKKKNDSGPTDQQAVEDTKTAQQDADAAAEQNDPEEWFLPAESRKYLAKIFDKLENEVILEVYTKEGVNQPYNEAMNGFVRDLSRLGEKIVVKRFDLEDEQAVKRKVSNSPTLLIQPDQYSIRFTGTPIGEEARTFIETLLLVSARKSGLSETSKEILGFLEEERRIMIFVDPDCPYCPGQTATAFKAAIERPDLVRADCIETRENQEKATQYQAFSLPFTVVNEEFSMLGLQPEERFILEMTYLRKAEDVLKEKAEAAGLSGIDSPSAAEDHAEVESVDLLIIGGGPAGMTAAIYAERSGLSTVVLEKNVVGGQVALTPVVENYPGFRTIAGKKLVDIMYEQAREYSSVREGEEVLELKIGRRIETYTNRRKYESKALLFATGASSRRLGVPGEEEYYGRGISVCASCDGWQYKGKKVNMVGGGNSALTEALHLKNLGVDVTLVHRRDALRAQQHLQDSLFRENIPVLWDTIVTEFKGVDGVMNVVRLMNVKTGEVEDVEVAAAFTAIGWIPNSRMAEEIGVRLDEDGYIKVDDGMRTNIPRIYAAGDITGGVRQIVTAVGEGSIAAVSIFEDIAHPYWLKEESAANAKSAETAQQGMQR